MTQEEFVDLPELVRSDFENVLNSRLCFDGGKGRCLAHQLVSHILLRF